MCSLRTSRCGSSRSNCASSPARRATDLWLIDLAGDSETMLPPQRRIEIARPEDRLFIPAEYVPLFEQPGWRRGDRG